MHALVKGQQQPLDIASVVQGPGTRTFAFLSITFGMITNIDIGACLPACLGRLGRLAGWQRACLPVWGGCAGRGALGCGLQLPDLCSHLTESPAAPQSLQNGGCQL